MTLQSNFDEAGVRSLALGDPSGKMQPPSTTLVWAAGAFIIFAAGWGLYRGVTLGAAHHVEGVHIGVGGLTAAAVAAAAPAVVLPRDAQWSTLAGPKIDQPAPKMAASDAALASDDGAATASAAEDAQDASADAGPKDALEAVGDAQTAPPVNAAPAAPTTARQAAAHVAPVPAPTAAAHALPDPDKDSGADGSTP